MSASPSRPHRPWEDAMSVRANNAMQQVIALYEALGRNNLAPLYDALDDHVIWELYAPTQLPFAGVWRGRAGVSRFFSAIFGAVQDNTFDMREFVVMGDRVVAIGRHHGSGRSSGRPFDVPVIHVWDLVGGRVTRWRCALDSAAVQEAILAPAPQDEPTQD